MKLKLPLHIEQIELHETADEKGIALVGAGEFEQFGDQYITDNQTYYPNGIELEHAEQIVGMSECVLLLAKLRSTAESSIGMYSDKLLELFAQIDKALEAQGVNWMEA